MALTVAKVTGAPDTVFGNLKVRIRDITFDASYPTGGESLTAANLGLKTIFKMDDAVAKNAAGTAMLPVRYDYANAKLQAYRYDGASAGKANMEEAANTTDLALFSVRIIAFGT